MAARCIDSAHWCMLLTMRIAVFSCLLVQCLAAQAATVAAKDPEVQRGVRLYEELDYEQTLAVLNAALGSHELDADDRVMALAYIGRAHAILGRESDAKLSFQAVLQLRPDFAVSWEESPRIRAAFQTAKVALSRAQPNKPTPMSSPQSKPEDVDLFPQRNVEPTTKAPTDVTAPMLATPSPWWTPLLRYTGMAAAGVGLATVGTGVYFGHQADSKRSLMKRDASLSQQEGWRLHTEASDLTKRANLLFIVGGGISVLGLGLLTGDLLAAPSPKSGTVATTTAAAATYVIEGVVTDRVTGQPIPDASVQIGNAASPMAVDRKTGEFKSWPLPVGQGLVEVRVDAPGYRGVKEMTPQGGDGEVRKVALQLDPANVPLTGEIRGKIANAKTGRKVSADVFVPALKIKVQSDKNGEFSVTVTPGEYDVIISAKGLVSQKKRLKVRPGDVLILNVDMSAESD